jgi:ketosteroid isomerase-like protein
MNTMTHTDVDSTEGRRDLARRYFTLLDTGGDFLALFAADATVTFPKHLPARGIEQIRALVGDVAPMWKSIEHAIPYFNYYVDGEVVVVEGLSKGELADGGVWSETAGFGGRFCNVFEIRGGLIQRMNVHLDPDYAGADTGRYPWLADA